MECVRVGFLQTGQPRLCLEEGPSVRDLPLAAWPVHKSVKLSLN